MGFKHVWLVIAALFVVSAAATPAWGPDNFPDPKRDINLCGRGKSSNICDPDGLLSKKGGDRVEGILLNIWNGVDPYIRAQCGDQGLQGYQVAVALMRKMDIHKSESAAEAARRIAKAIHAKWGVGLAACDNGVLLLLAIDDRQVYISTGAGAQQALSDNALGDIISAMKPKLRARDYDEAVEQAVVDIGLGLAGHPPAGEEWEWFPVIFFGIILFMILRSIWKSFKARRQYRACCSALQRVKEEQDKLRTREWSKPRTCPVCLEEFRTNPEEVPEATAPPMPGGEEASSSAPAAAGPGSRSPEPGADDPSAPLLASESGENSSSSSGLRRRNSGKVECGAAEGACSTYGHAGKVARAGEHGSHPKKTPITLRCGHTFCEPCLEQWMERASTCPICRERVDGEDGPGPTVRDQYQSTASTMPRERGFMADDLLRAELIFRLMRLQTMYPSFITPSVIDNWREEAQATGTFNWEQAREFLLNDPAVRAQHEMRGSGGNSMSFGGGGGGGGGGAGGSW